MLVSLVLGFYVFPWFHSDLKKKSLVAVGKKKLPHFCVMCTLMLSASLIWMIFLTFSCSSCTEKYNLLLPTLCFYIMCFLDFIKLNHFFWQQLRKKTPCFDDVCFLDIIKLFIFSGSSCTEKHHPFLPAYSLDLSCFINVIEILNCSCH